MVGALIASLAKRNQFGSQILSQKDKKLSQNFECFQKSIPEVIIQFFSRNNSK